MAESKSMIIINSSSLVIVFKHTNILAINYGMNIISITSSTVIVMKRCAAMFARSCSGRAMAPCYTIVITITIAITSTITITRVDRTLRRNVSLELA